MRCLAMLFAAAAMIAAATCAHGAWSADDGTAPPVAEAKIRLAQTSTVTNCMMSCNSTAASCQTGCFVPGMALSVPITTQNANTPISNPTASTTCVMGCTNSQLSCQSSCALKSPSP